MRRFRHAAIAALLLLLGSTGVARADARADKVQLYVEVHNMFAQRMHANHDRYTAALAGLDAEHPCAGERTPESGLYNTADSTGTIAGYRRRLRRAPRLPQDALVTAMLDAAAIQVPTFNSLNDYYHRDRHLADACAEGNASHTRLMSAFAAFFEADGQLLTFLEAETRQQQARELVEVEHTHGRNFRYFQLRIVGEIEVLRDVLSAETHDVDALARALDAIAASSAEIGPRATSAPQDVHSDLYQGGYLTFLQRVDTLVELGRRFVTTVRDAHANDSARSRAMNELERAFTEAIERSNAVRYSDRVH